MEELPRRVDRERRGLLSMKRAKAHKILSPGFLELDIVANHADNVRLLPHRFLKVAESGHGAILIVRERPELGYCGKLGQTVEILLASRR
jgi:hypothetical protein